MRATSLAIRCAHGLVVSAIVFGLICAAPRTCAQDQPASKGDNTTVAEVVVTGSRIARQSAFDTPTPVTTVDSKALQFSGTVDVGQALSQIPGFVAATNGGAQSNVVPGGEDYLNLRGLGQVRNLVLVNGRRFTVQ